MTIVCINCGQQLVEDLWGSPRCMECDTQAMGPDECDCGEPIDRDCNGNPRCPICDGPCPCCDDGGLMWN
jgi:hypothetical protein